MQQLLRDHDEFVLGRDDNTATWLPQQRRIDYAQRRNVAAGIRRKDANRLTPEIGHIEQILRGIVADVGRTIESGRWPANLMDRRLPAPEQSPQTVEADGKWIRPAGNLRS